MERSGTKVLERLPGTPARKAAKAAAAEAIRQAERQAKETADRRKIEDFKAVFVLENQELLDREIRATLQILAYVRHFGGEIAASRDQSEVLVAEKEAGQAFVALTTNPEGSAVGFHILSKQYPWSVVTYNLKAVDGELHVSDLKPDKPEKVVASLVGYRSCKNKPGNSGKFVPISIAEMAQELERHFGPLTVEASEPSLGVATN